MSTDHPWAEIAPGRARRVDADHVSDFFWGLTLEGEPELLLDFPTPETTVRLPQLRGLTAKVSQTAPDRSRLILRLADPALRDLFWRLCRDIVDASRAASDEEAAAHLAIHRTWRWHHLLRGGRLQLLTPEEQKGLIGELHVLRRLVDALGAGPAVESWRGPLGAPKDFEVASGAVEAKARRGAATPHVRISSEDQLDLAGVSALFLHVIDLSAAGETGGFTLTEVARRITDLVIHEDEGLLEPLEERLAAAGFTWADDYSEFRWAEGQHRLFHVTDEFPRLEASSTPVGVSRVRYEVDLNALHEFESDWTNALPLLTGE